MNPAQSQLYYRTWSDAAKAHGWNSKAGIAAALAAHHAGQVWESPELNQLLATIYTLAQSAAELAAVAVSTDHLRHACTAIATGQQVSSKSFTNADFDKVLALLRVLAKPTVLNALLAFQNGGEAGERRRHLHVITSADAPYWQRIAADRFGHADLDRLTLEQLRQLSLTIRNRQRAHAHPTQLAA